MPYKLLEDLEMFVDVEQRTWWQSMFDYNIKLAWALSHNAVRASSQPARFGH